MNCKISELQARYGLSSKQSVYDRMRALKIIPVSRGEISSQALDKLDKLNEFMKKNPGAKIWEFPRDVESLPSEQPDKSTGQLDKSTGQLDNFSETLQLVEAIARHFAADRDPLAKYKALEYAADSKIILSTSKIQELIGIKPRGSAVRRGTFTVKATGRIGREKGWKVHKTN